MALKGGGGGHNKAGGLQACLDGLAWRLLAMSESVLGESPPALRKKYEQLITELVRQRDATRRLQVRIATLGIKDGVRNSSNSLFVCLFLVHSHTLTP